MPLYECLFALLTYINLKYLKIFIMKKYLLIATASLIMSACNQPGHNQSVSQERDSLLSVISTRDSSINEFISSFNDVERSLDSVAVKQHIISINTNTSGSELKANQKTRINTEIVAINNLMDKNRKRIAELSRKLKNSSNRNAQLEKTIATMYDQLQQKNVELTMMNEMLNGLYAEVVQLQVTVGDLTQTVSEQSTALHTAYYVIGKQKDLKRTKVIDRKGGLLGIGRTSKISDEVDNKRFTRIDYIETTVIPVNCSDVKIVTSHPSDSYTLEKENKKMIKNLVITNPEKFWSASKYLVIVKG